MTGKHKITMNSTNHGHRLSHAVIEGIRSNSLLQAALYHRSAKTEATKMLSRTGYEVEVLDSWENLGASVISLYSARISASSVTDSGRASRLMACIARDLLVAISDGLASDNLVTFGSGVTDSEKKELKAYECNAQRLVGAIAHVQGYDSAVRLLFKDLATQLETMPTTTKDSKSILQEICQSGRIPLPKYEVVGVTGLDHDQLFRVRVTVSRNTAEASGRSKRIAEQNAAGMLLSKLGYKADRHASKAANTDILTSIAASNIRQLPNYQAVSKLAGKLDLPSGGVNVLCLALVHPSYTNTAILGTPIKDYKLLAFLGSRVLEWAVKDAILRNIEPSEIEKAGGLAVVTKVATRDEILADIFDAAIDGSLLLLGRGEIQLATSSKIDFLQAFCGALFFARETSGLAHYSELVKAVPELDRYLSEDIKDIAKPREALLDAKTRLQEICQSIGLSASYDTQGQRASGMVTNVATVTLRSQVMATPVQAKQFDDPASKHQVRRKAFVEAELAANVVAILEIVMGTRPPTAHAATANEHIEAWLFAHTFQEALQVSKLNEARRKVRTIRSEFMGLSALKKGDITAFVAWCKYASNRLGRSFASERHALNHFYSSAGQYLNEDPSPRRLQRNVKALEMDMSLADPLKADIDMRSTKAFRTLIDEATSYRLKGSAIAQISISELVNQANLLLGRQGVQISTTCDANQLLLEVAGAHLELIRLLLGTDELVQTVSSITLTSHLGMLCVNAITLDSPESYLQTIAENPTWQTLCMLLPIARTEWTGNAVTLFIPNIVENPNSVEPLEFWWAYHLHGKLGSSLNDTISAMLHDLKNSILAYASLSQQALGRSSLKERYQLAADASRNMDHALSILRSVKQITNLTSRVVAVELSMQAFMKSILSEALALAPQRIAIVGPSKMDACTIWTSPDRLHSIVLNLLRNAVEVIKESGTIGISYSSMIASNSVRIEIWDTGPGFTDAQLDDLNGSVPISSSKKNGQGIGLLTVLLLTRELSGAVEFRRRTPQGTTVLLEIPSMPLDQNDPLPDLAVSKL